MAENIRNFRSIREIIGSVYEQLNALQRKGEASQGLSTGFGGLDRVLAGMGKSDLILVGARPGMGKTSFVLNIASNVAAKTGKAVCIFSLEMSAEQLVTRILSAPGMWMQNFTTNEPDDSMIEVAIEAMKLVIPAEEGKDQW